MAARRGRAFRPRWSLAAGWSAAPRVGWFPVVVAIAMPISMIRWVEYPRFSPEPVVHAPGRWAFPAALLAWSAWSICGRAIGRSAGERRRRQRGGDVWWRDREWPASGAERWIAAGIAGSNVMLALTVFAAFALCGGVFAYAGGRGWSGRAFAEYGLWVPTSVGVVIATWALPLTWLLVVLGPRLGRGRLVVAWPELPQRTGTRVSFHVATSPGGARIDGARVFLRCIRTRHSPFLPLAGWNARLAWVAEARLPLNAYVGPETHLRAEFDVPAGAPSTDFHAKDAVRWEVLVLGTVAGTDYAQGVDVPVYSA